MAFFSFLKFQTPPSFKTYSGRLKFFFSFVVISFLFWVMTKLSNTYTATVELPVHYKQVPAHILLKQKAATTLQLTLTTSGFQLLWYRFQKPALKFIVNPQRFDPTKTRLELNFQSYSRLFQNQLGGTTTIAAIRPLNAQLDYDVLAQKKVVVLEKQLLFETGYSLLGTLKISPDSIEISGPKEILDTINNLTYLWKPKIPLNTDFETLVPVVIPHEEITLITENVVLKGKVVRFTEKTFKVPITAIISNNNNSIKLFPRQVDVVCSLPLEQAAQINASLFQFDVVYNDSLHQGINTLEVQMVKFPKEAKNVRFQPKTVQYLLRK